MAISSEKVIEIADGLDGTRASKALFVILCFLPVVSTLLFGGVDTIMLGIFAVFAALIILLWFADALKMRLLRFRPSILVFPLIGLIAIGLIQLLPFGGHTTNELLDVQTANSISLDPFATWLFVVRLIVFLVFFLAALAFIDSRKRAGIICGMIVVFGTLVAFFGILQRLANPEAIYGMRPTPQAIPFGPFINQHHFAGFMEMTFGVTLGMLLGKGLKSDRKAFLILAGVIMSIAMIFTGSRGGVISFGGVIVFTVALTYFFERSAAREVGSQKVTAIVVGSALTLIVIGSVFYLGAGDSLLRGFGFSVDTGNLTSGRIHFWSVAFQIFQAHPILGSGLDSFGVAFTRYDTQNGFFRVENAHNEYLQALSETGVLGFACVAAFVVLLFRKGIAAIRAAADGLNCSIAIGALAGCFGIAIHSFFDFPLRTPSNALFFLLLVVLGTTAFRKTS